jgi:hypothetical protein
VTCSASTASSPKTTPHDMPPAPPHPEQNALSPACRTSRSAPTARCPTPIIRPRPIRRPGAPTKAVRQATQTVCSCVIALSVNARICRYGRVNCHRRRTLSVQSPGRFCGYNAPGKLVATRDAGPVTVSAACRQRAGMLSRTVLPSVPGPRYRSWLNSQPRRKPPNHAAYSGAWVIVLRRNGLAEAGCSSIWYRPAHSPGRLTGD